MNFNLDILENINRYLFPLFYYKSLNSIECEVYCPATLKSMYFFNFDCETLMDYSTKKSFNPFSRKIEFFPLNNYIFTRDFYYLGSVKYMKKCNPFRISKEYLNFLKSKTRII